MWRIIRNKKTNTNLKIWNAHIISRICNGLSLWYNLVMLSGTPIEFGGYHLISGNHFHWNVLHCKQYIVGHLNVGDVYKSSCFATVEASNAQGFGKKRNAKAIMGSLTDHLKWLLVKILDNTHDLFSLLHVQNVYPLASVKCINGLPYS